jgi:hypothetical protein
MTDTLVENVKQLKISDRCDRCSAQAFVLVKMVAGELIFCGHHYTKHQTTLDKMAFEIIDERGSINAKSESSPQ